MARNWMIDFDGVIANLAEAMIASCNERFGTAYATEDEDTWHWWKEQPKEYADYVWNACYPSARWMLENVQPYEGVLEALADLTTDGDLCQYAVIVTARPEEHKERIEQWLAQQHVPAITTIPVVCVGKGRKSHICEKGIRLENAAGWITRTGPLDTVVEDGVHNLKEMNPHRQALFLVDRPWNRHERITEIMRVSSLQDAIEHVAKGLVTA